MATVYLAIQENFEREVALKIMSSSLSEDSNFSERFLREARIVSRLVHPHIVTVHDVGIHNGHHYLAMEYIGGQDLKQRLPSLAGDQIFRLLREVASALDYSGRKGYVHRDVKPENIMLHAEDGRAVLMDFGIARAADSDSTMTRTGTALGTPHYMSPEQARGDAIDGRSDLYSLGVLFYYMLTGKVPYEADSAVAVGIKHLTAPIPSLPEPLVCYQPLINRLMAKKPDDRYQTGYDLIAALEHFESEPLNQWRPDQQIEYLTSREYTPVRSDQIPALGSGSNPNVSLGSYLPTHSGASPAQRVTASAPGSLSGMGEQVQKRGPAPREAITIPQEDLNERIQHSGKKSGSGFTYVVMVLGLCLAGGYFFRSELDDTFVYKEMAEILSTLGAEIPPLDNVEQPPEQDVSTGVPAPDLQPSNSADNNDNDILKSDMLKNESSSVGELSEQYSGAAGVDDSLGTASSGDPKLEALLKNSQDLAELVKEQPEQTVQLITLYREILSIQPEHPEVTTALAELRSNALSVASIQIDIGELDNAEQNLADAVAWFPGLEQDERYLAESQRLKVTAQINELLPLAEEYLARDRLIRPAEDNAKDTFSKILVLDPANESAKRGIERILERYLALANSAKNKRDNKKFQALISSGLSINSSYQPLLDLRKKVKENTAREQKIASLLMQAQIMEAEKKLFGEGQNAVTHYQTVLAIDPQQIDAKQSLEQIKKGLFAQVDALVGEQDYGQAIVLIEDALVSLPDDRRLIIKLQELHTSKPAIDNVTLSGQPITDPNAGVPRTINADRTLHVAFHYQGLEHGATVLQALLFDGARSMQIAAVPVMVMGDSGSTHFRVDRPVEGFTDGGYHLDIMLSGKRIFTNSFVISQ
jgi:serine/threonine protein kinase